VVTLVTNRQVVATKQLSDKVMNTVIILKGRVIVLGQFTVRNAALNVSDVVEGYTN
jgi:hypothetical protein